MNAPSRIAVILSANEERKPRFRFEFDWSLTMSPLEFKRLGLRGGARGVCRVGEVFTPSVGLEIDQS